MPLNGSTIEAIRDAKRTVLFAPLAVLLIVSFGETNPAFGEVSEEIRAKALEGKQIWEKIEDIKNKEVRTEKDELDEKKFQEQFDAIARDEQARNSHSGAVGEKSRLLEYEKRSGRSDGSRYRCL